jgi:hypothetical protein
MPLKVTKNETAVIALARRLLGALWDWSQEERCMNMIILQHGMTCSLAERCH